MKTNKDIVEEFRKQFPQFKGVGAQFPMFEETPVYTHVIKFIERSLEAKDKECEERVKEERVKTRQDIENALLSGDMKLTRDGLMLDTTKTNYEMPELYPWKDSFEALIPAKTDKQEWINDC